MIVPRLERNGGRGEQHIYTPLGRECPWIIGLGRKGYVADGSHVCWGTGDEINNYISPLIMLCHFLCEVKLVILDNGGTCRLRLA